MNSRRLRYERDWLLQKALSDPSEKIKLKAYSTNYKQDSNWVTFTQVENEFGDRIAGHINLPQKKVLTLQPDLLKVPNKPFQLTGFPSFYVGNNTKRGSLSIKEIIPLF